MKLVITKGAQRSVNKVAKFVEEANTDGAGDRWLDTLMIQLVHASQIAVQHAICRYQPYAIKTYRCFTYNRKWVIAYKINRNKFTVYKFALGAKLI